MLGLAAGGAAIVLMVAGCRTVDEKYSINGERHREGKTRTSWMDEYWAEDRSAGYGGGR
ncbi:hypothetical protein [Sulfuriroseicoccus oceanibius]|uniref:Uncharacterized protein n=1 Tax=Sulfuriroseicoccus oceanibius TaxID=2707525 RepID=A0A6B3L508_9BACT|nr:hypothetical protein [Sulfuriroseicoccus oceanibius]QQL43902.1 hypothetical protein G3M56_008330 [Sulfuriroseicoccus oceanibius]